jgi:hypothetical protein
MSRDISVVTAKGCGLNGRSSIPGRGTYIFCAAQRSERQTKLVFGVLPPEGKQPGHEANHSRPSSAKVKTGGAIHLHGVVFHSAQGQLYLRHRLYVLTKQYHMRCVIAELSSYCVDGHQNVCGLLHTAGSKI